MMSSARTRSLARTSALACAAIAALLALAAPAAFGASVNSYSSAMTPYHLSSTEVNGNPALHAESNSTTATTNGDRLSFPTRENAALSVNRPIPAFKLFLGYNVAGPGRLQLTHFDISPFYHKLEKAPVGGCVECTGNGRFGTPYYKGTHLREGVKGKLYLTHRSGLVEALYSANRIGRVKVYSVNANAATAGPELRLQGCTPANLALTSDEVFRYTRLPTVPCHARTAPGQHISVSAPLEISSTASQQASVSGAVAGTQWLVVFQSDAYKPCGVNALQEALFSHAGFEHKISGRFVDHFTTLPSSSPGYFCAYVQRGPRLRVGKKGGNLLLPYGRVSADTAHPYLAGDTIAVSSPPSASIGDTVNFTVSGTASVKEAVYVYATSGCAKTPQQEGAIDTAQPDIFNVGVGAFSKVIPLSFPAGSPSPTYICAYLQFAGIGGPTLGLAGAQVQVAGGVANAGSPAHATRANWADVRWNGTLRAG